MTKSAAGNGPAAQLLLQLILDTYAYTLRNTRLLLGTRIVGLRGRSIRSRRTRRRCAGRRARLAVGLRRHVTHAWRGRRVGRLGLRSTRARLGTGLLHAGVVEAIEQRAHHHGDRDRKHRDLGAAGRTFFKFRIGLKFVVQAVETRLTADFLVRHGRAVGIGRLVGHDGSSLTQDNPRLPLMFRELLFSLRTIHSGTRNVSSPARETGSE